MKRSVDRYMYSLKQKNPYLGNEVAQKIHFINVIELKWIQVIIWPRLRFLGLQTLGVAMAERLQVPEWERRSKVVRSIIPSPTSSFSTSRINKVPSIRVIVICSDHRLLWRNSYQDVDLSLTLDESILHRIIISFTTQVVKL